MTFILPAVTKALAALAFKFFSADILEKAIIKLLKYAASHSKTKVDDELVELLEKKVK